MKYRKKPVEVEAIQFDGYNLKEVADFMGKHISALNVSVNAVVRLDGDYSGDVHIHISTPEGIMTVNAGDYIIKGIKGEFYPCKPDIFSETFEKAEE